MWRRPLVTHLGPYAPVVQEHYMRIENAKSSPLLIMMCHKISFEASATCSHIEERNSDSSSDWSDDGMDTKIVM